MLFTVGTPRLTAHSFATYWDLRPLDAGHGWLIFGLPAAESAVHPADANDRHELYLMCDDLGAEMERLRAKGVECGPVAEARWGSITKMRLPGGGEIGLYEPKHPRP